MPRTRRIYVVKYVINGSKFKREYLDEKARNDRADLYATNGITVTCRSRIALPGEVVRDTTVSFAHG